MQRAQLIRTGRGNPAGELSFPFIGPTGLALVALAVVALAGELLGLHPLAEAIVVGSVFILGASVVAVESLSSPVRELEKVILKSIEANRGP